MYPIKEKAKDYLDNQGNVNLSLHLRNMLDLKPGDEINLYFHDDDNDVLCISKVVPHCHSCGTSNEKLGELFENSYLCEKCFKDFMMRTFGRA